MLKNVYIFVFMFLTLASYSQKSTLLQNINFRAKELKHSLNKTGDSLILSSEKTIYSVDIFNQNFEKTVDVRSNETKIPLHNTPLGRLVVQAKMPDKRIIMTLLRHEEIEETSSEKTEVLIEKKDEAQEQPIINLSTLFKVNLIMIAKSATFHNDSIAIVENTPTKQVATKAEELIVNDTQPKPEANTSMSISDMLNWNSKKANTSNKVFWISHTINSGTSSRKIMKMVTHTEADHLIAKYKAENQTQQGKLNELTIWEVFDTTNFIKKQTQNSDYIKSKNSDFFNTIPYFSSTKNFIVLN